MGRDTAGVGRTGRCGAALRGGRRGAWAATTLPREDVPLHFGIDGRADRFGSRAEVLWTFGLLGAGVLALFAGTVVVARRGSLTLMNVPHKDYWMAAERSPQFRRMLVADLAGLGGVTMLLLAALVPALDAPAPAGAHPAAATSSEMDVARATSFSVIPPAEWVEQRKVSVRQRMSMSGWWSRDPAISATRSTTAIAAANVGSWAVRTSASPSRSQPGRSPRALAIAVSSSSSAMPRILPPAALIR
jgi:hypothetical protein